MPVTPPLSTLTKKPFNPLTIAAAITLALSSSFAFARGQSVPFEHISTFDVIAGNGSAVAEIVDVSPNGRQLFYTDGDNGEIGFVNIGTPSKPIGDGVVSVGGEPTSLVVRGVQILVAVNTSESFTEPSGKLVVINRRTREIRAEYELGGQPDAIALSSNKQYAAIVIENERDEDLGDGQLPQFPSGGLLIVDLRGLSALGTSILQI
ncbi:MAG: hypothetical protein AAGA91_12795 [Pseudomonadota bacterium]